jgi:hypothetical protein
MPVYKGMKYYVPSTTIRPHRSRLLNIAAGSYAQLVYDQGVHALSFGGLPALILSQLFNVSLTGFPLVILLFPDGRVPSPRWRPVLVAYLAIAVATVVIATVAVLQVAIGHHVVLQSDGNLASLGSGRTAYAGLIMGVYLLCAGALWLAAVIRQALSWRRSDGERRQQLKWLASGAAVCGVLGISAVSTNSSIWEVLILGFAALPLAFATHLKDAVDLDSVRTDLTAVVHRVLEPAHVTLWLTPRDSSDPQITGPLYAILRVTLIYVKHVKS